MKARKDDVYIQQLNIIVHRFMNSMRTFVETEKDIVRVRERGNELHQNRANNLGTKQ